MGETKRLSKSPSSCQYDNCNLPIHSTDGKYCLGHAPLQNKINVTEQEFKQFLTSDKLRHRDFNFEGFVFTNAKFVTQVINSVFDSEVNFRNCEFHGKVMNADTEYCLFLENVTFQKLVDFTGSKFSTGIYFGQCRFHTECLFANVVVNGSTKFEGTNFNKLTSKKSTFIKSFDLNIPQGIGELYFADETVFQEELIIENKKFLSEVTFDNVTFEKHLAINKSNFQKKLLFNNCNFESVNFIENLLTESCVFQKSKHSGIANFNQTKFQKLNFNHVDFNASAYFENIEFKNEVNWEYTTFQETSFDHSVFEGICNFSNTVFYQTSTFNYTLFNAKTNFHTTQFLLIKDKTKEIIGHIRFHHTRFNDEVDFNYNFIQGNLILSNLEFSSNTLFHFRNTSFLGSDRVLFENINFKPFKTIFEGINTYQKDMQYPIVIAFRNCDLKDIYFTNNEMSVFSFYKSSFDGAIFISNRWNYKEERLLRFKYKRQNIIFEDNYTYYQLKLSENEKTKLNESYFMSDLSGFQEIASLYRRFKVALDNTKDYEQAGWFYFNEFEMKLKKAKKKSKPKFYLYLLYKIFAGYGEKPLWSFFWFLIFLLTFTFLNLFSGIKVNLENAINYDVSWKGFTTIFTSQFWSDFFNSFLFTLYRIIPIGYLPVPREQFLPIGADGYLIAFVNTGVLILFITFIAVGLKRIFRRF